MIVAHSSRDSRRTGPHLKRGRPRTTFKSRLRDLCDAYATLLADTPVPLTAGQPRPESRRQFFKAAWFAEKEGVLRSPWCWNLEAVAKARERVAFVRIFGPPGRPRTDEQLMRDHEWQKIILAALPGHPKWQSLFYQARRADPKLPQSWAGFLKLLDRLHIPYEDKAPDELARERGLAPPGEHGAQRAPRPRPPKLPCHACGKRSIHLSRVRFRTVDGAIVGWGVCPACARDPARIRALAKAAGLRGAITVSDRPRCRA